MRGRSFLTCPYLWMTVLLHAVLLGFLLLSIHWTLKEWPISSWDHYFLSALGFVNVWAVQVGTIVWLVDVVAYWLVQTRWGLGKSLVYGAATTIILSVLVVLSLAWAAARFDESIPVLRTTSIY